MKIQTLLFLIAAFLLSACSQKLQVPAPSKISDVINYTISPKYDGDKYSLLVEMDFEADDSDSTILYGPGDWGPAQDLNNCIKNFHVTNATVEEIQKGAKRLAHQPKAKINISYEVIQDFPYPLTDARQAFRPILQDDFFHFVGPGVFVYPRKLKQAAHQVNLQWKDFPEDWTIHNSFATAQKNQQLVWKDSLWLEAIFLGGKFRQHTIHVEGDPIYIAMRGKWNFTDEAYVDLLKKVITQQRKFWNDYEFPYFTVTIIPFLENEKGYSYQGSGLRNAFALQATPNTELASFEYLFNHELMHEWIGGQIKTAEPEEFRYWFSEGFTDYFTFINMRENGLLDEQGYIDAMNEVIQKYYALPTRTITNQELGEKFHLDYNNYGKLGYHRGCLFATYVDWKIRQDSKEKKTLKDAMQTMLKICKKEKKQMSDGLFIEIMNRYLKKSIQPDFEKYIIEGNLIPLENWMLGNNTIVKNESIDVFEVGFDFEKSKVAKEVIGIKEGSAAYKAGIRDGQKLMGYGMYFGEMDKQAEVVVRVDGEAKSIKYFPKGKSEEKIPQFYLK